MKFPDHKAALYLTHNDHLSYYQTVAQSVEEGDHGSAEGLCGASYL